MLDKMREGSQGVAAKVVLGVIILSFALAGVSSYLGGGSAAVAVVVNNQEISQASVDEAYKNERATLQQQYGEQFDLLAANPNFAQQVRAQATQQLISKVLISQAIDEMGLRVGDEQVKAEIRKMAEFEVDGQFDNERYLAVLRQASYTPARFSVAIKEDLMRRQLLQMLTDSEFVTTNEVDAAVKLQTQQRIAKILNIDVADFEDASNVTADDISTYYENNKQLYQYPEQVSVNYILLDGSTLADQITITQDDLETYYDHHKSNYQRAERRKVAHILINGDSDAAQEKAAAILAELKKGADFATLAKKDSDDTFSAKKDGELDWFERGVMDPQFDDAAFLLTKEAPLSDLVKTSFGYHIIKLLDVEEGETSPYSAVEKQVKVALQQEKMDELYYDLQQELGEVAFESPDSLDEASASINRPIEHTGLFSEENAPEVLADQNVLKTLFNPDFRDEGLNSDVIELSENKAIVVRVNEYQAPSTEPLSEVSDLIADQLKTERARENAQAFVDTLMAKLDNQESIDALLAERDIAFGDAVTFARYNRDQDNQIVEKIFKLAKPSADAVTNGWVTDSQGNFAVIALSKVVDAEPAATDGAMAEQLTEILTRSALLLCVVK